MEQKKKSVRVGTVMNGEHGPFILLGNTKNKDPKYDYTVQVRILRGKPQTKEEFASAEVLGVFVNPLVQMFKPGEQAPKSIQHELSVKVES